MSLTDIKFLENLKIFSDFSLSFSSKRESNDIICFSNLLKNGNFYSLKFFLSTKTINLVLSFT